MKKDLWIPKCLNAKISLWKLLAVNTSHLLWRKKTPHDSGWNQDLGMQTCMYMEAKTHLNCVLDYVIMQSTTSQSQQRNALRNSYNTFFFIELSLQNLVYFTLNIVLIWTSHTSVFNSSISSAQHVASNYFFRQCRSIPLISKFSGNCFFFTCSLNIWSTMGQAL